jgi:hypothetical protein
LAVLLLVIARTVGIRIGGRWRGAPIAVNQ